MSTRTRIIINKNWSDKIVLGCFFKGTTLTLSSAEFPNTPPKTGGCPMYLLKEKSPK
jgi:hypothetical protein